MTKQFVDPREVECIQSRIGTRQELIEEYLGMMQIGIIFDAVRAIRLDNGNLIVWDGKHRTEAAKLFGQGLWVEFEDGTRQDAEWKSFAANKTHGLRRNREDIAKAVHDALQHPFAQGKSDREIASWVGCDHKTVGKYRKSEAAESSGEIPQIPARTVTRADYAADGYTQDDLELLLKRDFLPVDNHDAVERLTEIMHNSERGKLLKANLDCVLQNGGYGKPWREPILYAAIRSVRSHLLKRIEMGYVASRPQRECIECHAMHDTLSKNDLCMACLDRSVMAFSGIPMVATIWGVIDRRLAIQDAQGMKREIYEAVRFGHSPQTNS